MSRLRRPLSIALAASLLVAACTRPEDARRTDETLPPRPTAAGSTAPVDDSVPTTTAPADTTTTPQPTTTTPGPATSTATPTGSTPPSTTATTATPTTEPPESPADLVLTFDSIGPWRFGQRDVDVVPGLAAILGAPADDVLSAYPVADEGSFLDETGEQSYVAPYGRTVCFDTSLCAQFGAGAPETLILTGWRLSEGAPSDLATEDGITVGATWADVASVIVVDPLESCFQVGYADAGGIDVTLLSPNEFFLTPDDGGDLVPNDVDPAEVTVIELRAGRHPIFLLDDC